MFRFLFLLLFFFNDTATTEIYTLSLHDALPIYGDVGSFELPRDFLQVVGPDAVDRKSTRLNSSHRCISYAVFCLKKKKKFFSSSSSIFPRHLPVSSLRSSTNALKRMRSVLWSRRWNRSPDASFSFFLLGLRPPPRSTLFPCTTRFR